MRVELGLELEHERAVDLAAPVPRSSLPASGQAAVSSFVAAGRTRTPRPSSVVPPAVKPTSGASAAYERRSP